MRTLERLRRADWVWILAHAGVLLYTVLLIGGFAVQFGDHEYPCPLCMLERMAMILSALGAVWIIARGRDGTSKVVDRMTGLGMVILGSIVGLVITTRHVLLHIQPGDPGYGSAFMGLHLYTWGLVAFAAAILAAGVALLVDYDPTPRPVHVGRISKALLALFFILVVANVVVVFALEGFHWTLTDDPNSYRLFS